MRPAFRPSIQGSYAASKRRSICPQPVVWPDCDRQCTGPDRDGARSRPGCGQVKEGGPLVRDPAPETFLACCFGENAGPKHVWSASETRFALPRNIRCRAKALSSRELALRAVRSGQGLRKTGRAGATPPKTALACTAGTFGEVTPGIFPCRKAERSWMVADVSLEGSGTGIRHSSETRSESDSRARSPRVSTAAMSSHSACGGQTGANRAVLRPHTAQHRLTAAGGLREPSRPSPPGNDRTFSGTAGQEFPVALSPLATSPSWSRSSPCSSPCRESGYSP